MGPGGQPAAQGPALGAVPGLFFLQFCRRSWAPRQPRRGPGAGLASRPPALQCSCAGGLGRARCPCDQSARNSVFTNWGPPSIHLALPPSADRPCATGLRALNFLVHAAVGTQCGQRLEDKARGSLHGNEHRVWEGKGPSRGRCGPLQDRAQNPCMP